MKVSICIATYNNPNGLRKLLMSLNYLEFVRVNKPWMQIVVVDNSSIPYAVNLIQEYCPSNIFYKVDYEPQKGIPFVRNKIIELTTDSDIIVWVDDDEWVSPCWLENLLMTYIETKIPVVTGPVIGILPSSSPDWAKNGSFFSSDYLSSGTLMNTFYTGNALMERSLFKKYDVRFDVSLALTGGSDSLLAEKLREKGIQFVWCQEAIVYEDIPTNRVTLSWFLKRRFRIGNTSVLINSKLEKGNEIQSNITILSRYLYSFIITLIISLFKGKVTFIKSIGYFSTMLGIASGLFSITYNEYGSKRYRK